jgi:23S rRNA (uracil1939-C5)-methyltransferase
MKKKKERQRVELNIDSIAFEGKAIGRIDNMVYFIKNAVPGDRVIAEITKSKKSYKEGFMVELLEPSKDRILPECKYFSECGGCSWQNLSYDKQLYWKKRNIADAFERIGKVNPGRISAPVPSPEVFRYRNKMEFSFGASRWLTAEEITREDDLENRHFALGLHVPERFDKVLDIDYCLIQSKSGDKVLKAIKDKALFFGVKAYHSRAHHGFLRNLVIRYTNQCELMVILITSEPELDEDHNFLEWFRNDLETEYLGIKSLIHAVNRTKTEIAQGDIEFVKGTDCIYEEILEIKYKISPFSFFQTNSIQLNDFISKIIATADLKNTDTVWDLYCGTGSITLPAAQKAKKVYGFELVESSISDAKVNASINNIENAEFHCVDLHKKSISEYLSGYPEPNVVIIDPPRAGMHPALVEYLAAKKFPIIVYVSCNPATQARDIGVLAECYEVVEAHPFDMFPHTFHIENIALLKLKT